MNKEVLDTIVNVIGSIIITMLSWLSIVGFCKVFDVDYERTISALLGVFIYYAVMRRIEKKDNKPNE